MKLPIIHDFRRSFLRISTLVTIVALLALGIASSYAIFIVVSQTFQPVDSVALYLLNNKDGECKIVGVILDNKGSLVDGKVNIIKNREILYTTTSRNGVYTVADPMLCTHVPDTIGIETRTAKINITAYRGPRTVVFEFSLSGTGTREMLVDPFANVSFIIFGRPDGYIYHNDTVVLFKLFILSRKYGDAVLATIGANTSSRDLKPRLLLYYTTTYVSEVTFSGTNTSKGGRMECTEGSSESTECRSIEIKDFVELHSISLEPHNNLLILEPRDDGNNVPQAIINYEFIVSIEQEYIRAALGSIGIGFFASFFPIVMMYLANVIMAKPKDSGALEFVLARPITRFDLYLSRYLAGVLTAIVSSALFMASIALSSKILVGVSLDIVSCAIMWLGLSASFIMFYTLFYAIASLTRSGVYLSIAMVLYIFFVFIWGLIVYIIALSTGTPLMGREITELNYILNYFNPRGYVEIAQYFVDLNYDLVPEVSVVNPYACIAVPMIWIVGLFTAGYKVFKRKSL